MQTTGDERGETHPHRATTETLREAFETALRGRAGDLYGFAVALDPDDGRDWPSGGERDCDGRRAHNNHQRAEAMVRLADRLEEGPTTLPARDRERIRDAYRLRDWYPPSLPLRGVNIINESELDEAMQRVHEAGRFHDEA